MCTQTPGGSSLQLAIEQDLAGTLVSSHSKLYSHKNCKKIVSSDVRLKLVQGKVFIANGNLYKPHADQMGHAVGLTVHSCFLILIRPGCAWLWADHRPASNSLV